MGSRINSTVWLAILLFVVAPFWLDAAENGKGLLDSGEFQDAMRWLPSDTETVTVARGFSVGKAMIGAPTSPPERAGSFGDFLRASLFEGLDEGRLKPFVGKTVSLAVRGERNFDTVSAFGGMRRESCTILFFQEDLGGVWAQIEAALRDKAESVQDMENHRIYRLPSTTVMESVYEPKEWQGLFVTRLKPHVLLIASSGRFLEEVLKRSSGNGDGRTPLESRPEWDEMADEVAYLTVRQIPEAADRTFFDAVTLAWKPETLTVSFLGAKPGAEKAIKHMWLDTPRKISSEILPSVSLEQNNLTLTLSTATFKQNAPLFFWYGLLIHRLNGEDGTLFSGAEFIPAELKPDRGE